MKRFNHAIVKTPCKQLINGLTTAELGLPDYDLALRQHQYYITVLQQLGLDVTILGSDEAYPDSTFVEDTTLLTPEVAILTRPGAPSRRGEVDAMAISIRDHYKKVESIRSPGTVDAGDIMMVGSYYYIGLSGRTNREGAKQVIRILRDYGMDGTTVPLENVLHLKSGLSYLENNHLVISGEFIGMPLFDHFNRIEVPDNEQYAANCLWLNGTVLMAGGFPVLAGKIREAGFPVIECDMSEFRKLDGGLSCLSLRF